MAGSAAFFAPLTRTVPSSGLPPRMTNLSMEGCPNLNTANAELVNHGADLNSTGSVGRSGAGRLLTFLIRILDQRTVLLWPGRHNS